MNSLSFAQSEEDSSVAKPKKIKTSKSVTTTTTMPPLVEAPLSPEEKARQEKLNKVKDNIQVRWFKPTITPEKEDLEFKNPQKISMAGESKPGTRIYLQADRVFAVNADGVKNKITLAEKQIVFLPGIADRRGIFLFQFNLTQGNYEIAVSFVDPDAQSMSAAKIYNLKLGVTQGKVNFSVLEEGGKDQFKVPFDYVSGGLGLNYSVFNKTSDVPAELRFSSFKIPSVRLGYATTFEKYPNLRADASLLMAPGETKNGTRVTVQGGTYNWLILSGDTLYSKPDWTKDWNDYRIRWAVRSGVQMHSLPFLKSKTTAVTDQEIASATLNTVTAGGHVDILTDSDFSYTAQMRLAIPFLNMSNINMKNPLSFDGSVGGIYRKNESRWSYGMFWYGQWLQFEFQELDKFDNRSHSGKLDIMFSNIEFRTMYNF